MHRFFEVLRDLTRADGSEADARAKTWSDRTRDERRQTAPYTLGWEEGYDAAYRLFLDLGEVPALESRRRSSGN